MFICKQKINFICHFFFEILQRQCRLAFLGTLGMLDHPNQKSYYQFVGNFHAYLHVKINFITPFFLQILQRNSNLVILSHLGMSGHTHLK